MLLSLLSLLSLVLKAGMGGGGKEGGGWEGGWVSSAEFVRLSEGGAGGACGGGWTKRFWRESFSFFFDLEGGVNK